MKWKKLGLIFKISSYFSPEYSHAMLPTPVHMGGDIFRVFFSSCDFADRAKPFFMDLELDSFPKVLYVNTTPVLALGEAGCFDDNGVVCSSILHLSDGRMLMYYVGFELCTKIRYRLFTGLAVSEDEGFNFGRLSATPVLDRTDKESLFRCAPFVTFKNGKYLCWYVAGNTFVNIRGKSMPQYDIRFIQSNDGITWPPQGQSIFKYNSQTEHGFGRPWVTHLDDSRKKLFYSIRSKTTLNYKLGYAEGKTYTEWSRQDHLLNLNCSQQGFDSEGIMYTSIINHKGSTYCLYNGNNFGRDGFGIAILVK